MASVWTTARGTPSDKTYEKRKAGATIIEKQVQEALAQDRGGGTAGAGKVAASKLFILLGFTETTDAGI